MSIAYHAHASAEATSLTLPDHRPGDMMLMFALRTTLAQNVTMPSGWYYGGNQAGLNSDSHTVAWKNCFSSNELSGIWTNANFLLAVAYRPTSKYHFASILNGGRSINGGSATVRFPQTTEVNKTVASPGTATMPSSEGVVVGYVASPSTAVSLNVTPADMTNRVVATGASSHQIVVHDTGVISSRSLTDVTLSGVTAWISGIIILTETSVEIAGGGGGASFPPIGPGGLVY